MDASKHGKFGGRVGTSRQQRYKPGGWEKEQQKWKYLTKECSCVLNKQKKY